MKEMEYTGKIGHREVLVDEIVNGYRIVVLSLGTHPTAYVMVPDDHPMLEHGFDTEQIVCHGGLTYSKKGLLPVDEDCKHFWIGWDYAHAFDYCKYENGVEMSGHKYTTREIRDEAIVVAGQIKGIALLERKDESQWNSKK